MSLFVQTKQFGRKVHLEGPGVDAFVGLDWLTDVMSSDVESLPGVDSWPVRRDSVSKQNLMTPNLVYFP